MGKRNYTRIDNLVQRNLRRCWQNQMTQCKFRGEEYHITWEEYRDLWLENDRWQQKGTTSSSTVMWRIDKTQPWSVTNIEFMTRTEQLKQKKTRKKS